MVIALLISITTLIIIDYIGLLAVKKITIKYSDKLKKGIRVLYKTISICFIIFALVYITIIFLSNDADYIKYRNFFVIWGFFVAIYFPKLLFICFFILDILIHLLIFLLKKTVFKNFVWITKIPQHRIILKIGFVLSIVFFCFIVHGIFIGRTDFQIKNITISSEKLPAAFQGFKIAQISDMHLGSFKNANDIEKGLKILMNEKPDMIVMTGDLINNEAKEAENFISLFKQMSAPYGMYSVLGNHDMGDYRRWYTIKEKNENLNTLKLIQKEMGFQLLMNQNKIIRKGNDSIALIGVLNWGKPPFRKYGNLDSAMMGLNHRCFKILLSHDPSHWDLQVRNKSDITLTLSGHTHGMQMGINCCGIFWSPVSIKYRRWGGLYKNKDQYLYVNLGFGFLGFPGRIGMLPEITIITLSK